MTEPEFSNARWRKAIGSGDGGCVEVAHSNGWIGVRDTKDRGSGPILAFTEREWRAFITAAGNGEFDYEKLI